MSKIRVNVFGPLEVFAPDGHRITVAGAKQQALLAYLVMNIDNPPSRDQVMTVLWGDRFNDQARQSLRQGLSKLRQSIDPDGLGAIIADQDRLAINPDVVSVDLVEFQNLVGRNTATADEKAIQLFQKTILDGLYLKENAFEDWLSGERARISEAAFPVFERLAAQKLKDADQAASQKIAKQLVDIDPLREGSHRLLMRILAQSGQRAAAIQQYKACEEVLRRELDIEPDPETQQLLDNIKSPPGPPPQEAMLEQLAAAESNRPRAPDSASAKVNITVLPFSTMGRDPEMDGFAEGLTEDTTAMLTKYRWLDVIASLPVEGGPASTAALRKLATDHQVQFSVEGSVRKLGAKLRVTAQLVELETGKYIWVQRFDSDAADLFDLQDELSETIAASVESELVAFEGEKARSMSSSAMGAWDAYHLGLATQYEFSTEGNARAQSLFRRAIALDPMFSAAYARLAYALVLSTVYFDADQGSGILEEALELARKAAQLDDQDAVARFAVGRVYLAMGEYERSISEMEHAIELNPSLAQAHCGLGDSLAYLGRSEDAMPSFQEATRLSPQDPHRWAFSTYAAIACIFNGEYARAEEWAQASVRVPNAHFWANAALVSALGHLGRKEEAAVAVRDLLAQKPDFTQAYARERLFYLRDKAQVDRYVEGLAKAGVP